MITLTTRVVTGLNQEVELTATIEGDYLSRLSQVDEFIETITALRCAVSKQEDRLRESRKAFYSEQEPVVTEYQAVTPIEVAS